MWRSANAVCQRTEEQTVTSPSWPAFRRSLPPTRRLHRAAPPRRSPTRCPVLFPLSLLISRLASCPFGIVVSTFNIGVGGVCLSHPWARRAYACVQHMLQGPRLPSHAANCTGCGCLFPVDVEGRRRQARIGRAHVVTGDPRQVCADPNRAARKTWPPRALGPDPVAQRLCHRWQRDHSQLPLGVAATYAAAAAAAGYGRPGCRSRWAVPIWRRCVNSQPPHAADGCGGSWGRSKWADRASVGEPNNDGGRGRRFRCPARPARRLRDPQNEQLTQPDVRFEYAVSALPCAPCKVTFTFSMPSRLTSR